MFFCLKFNTVLITSPFRNPRGITYSYATRYQLLSAMSKLRFPFSTLPVQNAQTFHIKLLFNNIIINFANSANLSRVLHAKKNSEKDKGRHAKKTD